MIKTLSILLVDDHPIIIDAYKNSLNQYKKNNNYHLLIDSAYCCETALQCIENRSNSKSYNIVFIDIRLPPSKDGKFNSGKDLAYYFKKEFSDTKIIIITGYYDPLTLGQILQSVNPDGLLFKGDIGQTTINDVMTDILNGIPSYSATILKLLRQKISSDIVLNKIDKQLLYELSKGSKTKDLTKTIPLSIGGIEKRKRHLKEVFGTCKKDDSELIDAAIHKGFI